MLEGKPSVTSEAETMRAIRDILSDAETTAAPSDTRRCAGEPAAESTPDLTLTPVRDIDAKLPLPKFTTVPDGQAPARAPEIIRTGTKAETGTPVAPSRGQQASKQAPSKEAKLRKQREPIVPTGLVQAVPRWGAIAVLFGCAMLYPALIVIPAVLTLFVVVGSFLFFGADRVWATVSRALAWYAARRPARAARLFARLDAFAVRWDAVLDRFPEGSVDGLYLPDLATVSERSRREDAALDERLARMHSQV